MKKRLLYNGALILLLLVNSTVLMAQWTQQNTGFASANRAISQISIVDANTVWATAVDGTSGAGVSDFTRTINGGTTWTASTVTFTGSAAYYLTNLHAMSATTAFAAMPPMGANGGVIAKTTDGGTSWSIANSPDFSASWLNWVHFFDANNGVCMGDADSSGEYVIYTTSDGGISWTKVDGSKIPNPNVAENGQANKYESVGNSIWFTTGKGRVYSSSDKGLTWSASNPGITLSRVKFRTQLDGIAYGLYESRKTVDGGKNWEILIPSGFYLRDKTKGYVGDLANIPGTSTWFNTAGSTVCNGSSYSFNDGVSYFDIDTTSTNKYSCAKFLDAQTGWAGSLNTSSTVGGIYKWCSVVTPTLGTITQPATAAGTGSIVLNNLPATGTWDIETVTSSAITKIVTAGTGTTKTISALLPGRYRFRVNYGGCLSMVTDEIVISAMTQATNITFTSITDKSMTVNWTRGTGDKVIVVARRGSPVNSNPANAVDFPSGGEYTAANSILGLGGAIVGALNYVVYVGTGNSVNVTGLLAGVNYNFAVYEYTYSSVTSGTPAVTKINTNYLLPALVGNSSTTTTTSNAPCSDFNYLSGNAQNISGTYTPITLGTEIVTATNDNQNSDVQNIGFNFNYNCQKFDKFILNTNGFIKLGDSEPAKPLGASTSLDFYGGALNGSNPANVNIIHAFNHALTGDANTQYRVFTEGISPNRICTIQFKDVKDKSETVVAANDAPAQFSKMNFQIKLYETTNVIDVVYGDFTYSTSPITTATNKVKSVTCGLRGSSFDNSQSLIVNKWNPTTAWSTATFSNTIGSSSGILFGNSTTNAAYIKPDAGRTFRFVPTSSNDLSVGQIYSMGETSSKLSNPQGISAVIYNLGLTDKVDADVKVTVTGATTFTDTKKVTIKAGEFLLVNFSTFSATITGSNTITVTVPTDDVISNNTNTWTQIVTENICNYSTKVGTPVNSLGGGTAGGEYYVKYLTSTHAQFNSVKIFIPFLTSNEGKIITAVLLDDNKVKLAESAPYTIVAGDKGKWKEFTFASPLYVKKGSFYAGISCKANAVAFYPLGVERETYIRRNTYYYSGLNQIGFDELPANNTSRLMIGATLTEIPAPLAGIASASSLSVCSGNTVNLTLTGSRGIIKWQKSLDNGVIWTDIPSSASSTLISPAITVSTSFRAVVSQEPHTDVNSNQVDVLINSIIITGNEYLCPATGPKITSIVLTAPTLSGAIYEWKNGSTTLSGQTSATYTATEAGSYTVKVTVNGCIIVSPSKVITVNSTPTPVFTPVSVCSGQVPIIPTTSTDGIKGSWLPAIEAITADQLYTFTAAANQCASSTPVSLTVKVNSLPISTISGNQYLCNGISSVALTSSLGASYVWKKESTILSSITQNYTATEVGSYTVIVKGTNGCTAESVPKVIEQSTSLPTPLFTAVSVCTGKVPTIPTTSTNGITGSWSPALAAITVDQLYTFTATANQCVAITPVTLNVTIQKCAGIEELTLANINVYPNPTVGKINLFIPIELTNANVQLVDIAGKIVFSSKMNFTKDSSTEFDFNELSNGNYILKVNEYQTKVLINK